MIDWAGVATVITAATSGVVSLVTLYRVGRAEVRAENKANGEKVAPS
jgi:hypothetical protein